MERYRLSKQVKSDERVKKYGEVYTRPEEINDMLDLLPEMTIERTFLEPTCGNGNFVLEILKRKFDLCKKRADYIAALESVYAIDLLEDNVKECRDRVKVLYNSYGQKENIDFLLETNIFQGNSLAIMKLIEKCSKG